MLVEVSRWLLSIEELVGFRVDISLVSMVLGPHHHFELSFVPLVVIFGLPDQCPLSDFALITFR